MSVGTITIGAVKALAPGTTLWDGGHREAVPGYGARRQRDKVAYVIKYRVHGRQRFLTIDKHGRLTPEQARREAKKLLGQVAGGKDPAEAKAQARRDGDDTLRKIADAYLKAVKPKQRPATHSEIKRYLETVWKPLHSVSVFAITRRQITAQVAKIADARGTVSATRARAALCTVENSGIWSPLTFETASQRRMRNLSPE